MNDNKNTRKCSFVVVLTVYTHTPVHRLNGHLCDKGRLINDAYTLTVWQLVTSLSVVILNCHAPLQGGAESVTLYYATTFNRCYGRHQIQAHDEQNFGNRSAETWLEGKSEVKCNKIIKELTLAYFNIVPVRVRHGEFLVNVFLDQRSSASLCDRCC